jgi:tubulin polyglutamylase TTLL11
LDISKAKGDCFQILGFDIFIDSNLKAWLFEINDHPSLNINLEKEGEKGLIKEPSEIDKFIKVKVLGDAIKFMKSKKGCCRSETESYKGFIRILPDPEYSSYDAFYQAKEIFDKLSVKK